MRILLDVAEKRLESVLRYNGLISEVSGLENPRREMNEPVKFMRIFEAIFSSEEDMRICIQR